VQREEEQVTKVVELDEKEVEYIWQVNKCEGDQRGMIPGVGGGVGLGEGNGGEHSGGASHDAGHNTG
jgi:hypothetical protein